MLSLSGGIYWEAAPHYRVRLSVRSVQVVGITELYSLEALNWNETFEAVRLTIEYLRIKCQGRKLSAQALIACEISTALVTGYSAVHVAPLELCTSLN